MQVDTAKRALSFHTFLTEACAGKHANADPFLENASEAVSGSDVKAPQSYLMHRVHTMSASKLCRGQGEDNCID